MDANNCDYTTSAVFISICEDVGGYTPGVPSIRGKRIVELRLAAGFATQKEFAKKAKIDPSKLSRLENDKPVNLTLKTIERLAKTLRVLPGELFSEPRPEGDAGLVHSTQERDQILNRLVSTLDTETPAEDSWRGDVLKAIAVLNRALRRTDAGTGFTPSDRTTEGARR
jgi:transcriptional regulator with XRE-family HTH domain